jgi:hypothetical protein
MGRDGIRLQFVLNAADNGFVAVLVTGGAGFLGSHLVARLRAAGEEPFVSRSDSTT